MLKETTFISIPLSDTLTFRRTIYFVLSYFCFLFRCCFRDGLEPQFYI